MYSNDISLTVTAFLSNQKLLPRCRLIQQQPPAPTPSLCCPTACWWSSLLINGRL